MMLQDRFNALAEALGSPYAAVNYLARLARDLMIDNKDHILESKAITWALTGEKPEPRKKKYNYLNTSFRPLLEDVLCYVDDEDVCESVRESYETSLKAKHLIYCYNSTIDEYQKARVRVLVRMIWYNIEYERRYI